MTQIDPKFGGENAVLINRFFQLSNLDRAIQNNEQIWSGLQNPSSITGTRYRDSIDTLKRLRALSMRDNQISYEDRARIQTQMEAVRDARLAAQRGHVTSTDRLVQNPGEPGIYRNPGTGDIVGRDPGARTAIEKDPYARNKDEPGIRRDAGTGVVRERDPGAKTALERSDENDRYARSGRRAYRPGPDLASVEAGSRNLREGDRSDAVRTMQERLRAAGFNPGRADGLFGPRTAAAVRNFLQSQGLAQSDISYAEMNRLLYMSRR